MVRLSKKRISREFERLVGFPLKNFETRRRTELEKSLKFQRLLAKQRRLDPKGAKRETIKTFLKKRRRKRRR